MAKTFALAAVALLALILVAQAAPVVDFPSGNAAWTIEITYPGRTAAASSVPGAAPAPGGSGENKGANATPVSNTPGNNNGGPGLPEKVVAQRVGDRTCYSVTWQDKSTTDFWVVGPYLAMEDPKTHSVNVLPFDRNTGFGPYDGSLFDWVKESMLVNSDPWKGKPAQCYRGSITLSGNLSFDRVQHTAPPTITMQAWVDPETRRPLGLEDSTRTCVFTFQPVPTKLPALPPSLENALKLYASSFRSSPLPRGRSR